MVHEVKVLAAARRTAADQDAVSQATAACQEWLILHAVEMG
jgi:hypothetical protein